MRLMTDEPVMEGIRTGPLGATVSTEGVHFAVFSEHATRIDLCLFRSAVDVEEFTRIPLHKSAENIWHQFVSGLKPGQMYAYRADGRYAPAEGHRFNPQDLLLDPYARAMTIAPDLSRHEREAQRPTQSRKVAVGPKCLVHTDHFDWGGDVHPNVPWRDTVIYECHVKGMTMRHPGVPPEFRGLYLGLASPVIIEHLHSLGVTTLELLPVQHCMSEPALIARGRTNYWGYNTIGFFAPDPRFATGSLGQQVIEFKQMVKSLHAAGIEVVLDVVYNHTAEGGGDGPTLCFRGMDNASYYLLDPNDRARYANFTGCGNTLNLNHPQVRRMVLDSLRYWASEMHVDGYRFDLATALLRDADGAIQNHGIYEEILNDPLLGRLKIIVEPWDAELGGYRLGGFQQGIHEWNDRYRDCVRRFWRGDAGTIAEFATRLAGSADLFNAGRAPLASINYVCAHDGFTLEDVVSYAEKHNKANGENNADGANSNYSQNMGVEGPTSDPRILKERECVKRALMATLALSQGVPMICMGDELGRTQFGNNNAYCQDRPESWVDWSLGRMRREFLEFTQRVFAMRRGHESFRRDQAYRGTSPEPRSTKDVAWIREDGMEMTVDDWHDSKRFTLGAVLFDGATLLMLINAGLHSAPFFLPPELNGRSWRILLSSSGVPSIREDGAFEVPPRTIGLWTPANA